MPPNSNILRRFLFFNPHADPRFNNSRNNRQNRNKFNQFFTFINYALVSIIFYLLVFKHRIKQNKFHYEIYLESSYDASSYKNYFPFLLNDKNFLNFLSADEEEQTRDIILEILKHHDSEKLKSREQKDPEGGVKSLFYDLNFFKLKNKVEIFKSNISNVSESYDGKNEINSVWKSISDLIVNQYTKRKTWSNRLKKLSQKLINPTHEVVLKTNDINNLEIETIKPSETILIRFCKKMFNFFRDQIIVFSTIIIENIKTTFDIDNQALIHYSIMIDKSIFTMFKMIHTDYWISLNAIYCCLIIFAKLVHKIVFGNLRSGEQIHLKDKICNFVFNKMIFMFGLLNIDNLVDFTLWTSWFAITCFLHSTALLLKSRIDYLSLSPRIGFLVKVKLGTLLAALIFWSNGLTFAVIVAYVQFNMHAAPVYLFLLYECFMLQLNAYHILYNVLINAMDSYHTGCWENKNKLTYYGDLVFGISILIIDLFYHLHMLLWGSIILSMASLFICMELRWLFGELKTKIIKHQNYLRIMKQMDRRYPMANGEDLKKYNSNCSICWDPMRRARKLPCDHLFHDSCLRSWLEHDSSCPICRRSLNPQHPLSADSSTAPPVIPLPIPLPLVENPIQSAAASASALFIQRNPGTNNDIPQLPSESENVITAESSLPLTPPPSSSTTTTTTTSEDTTRANPLNPGAVNHTIVNQIIARLSRWNQRIIFNLIDLLFNASAALTIAQPHARTFIHNNNDNNHININNASIRSPTAAMTTTITDNVMTIPLVTNNGVTLTRRVSRVNRFFHFDASRYASWLPTFSLQVSHLQLQELPPGASQTRTILQNQTTAAATSPLSTATALTNSSNIQGNSNQEPVSYTTLSNSLIDDMVNQVSNIFPHIPNTVIRSDLILTWSVDRTIENILEGPLGLAYLHLDDDEEEESQNTNLYPTSNNSNNNTFTGTFTADFTVNENTAHAQNSRYSDSLSGREGGSDSSSESSLDSNQNNSTCQQQHPSPPSSSAVKQPTDVVLNSEQDNNNNNNQAFLDHYFQRYSASNLQQRFNNYFFNQQPSTSHDYNNMELDDHLPSPQNSNQDNISSTFIKDHEELKENYDTPTCSPFISYDDEFSENVKERESMLTKRKKVMILNARKHFISLTTTSINDNQMLLPKNTTKIGKTKIE